MRRTTENEVGRQFQPPLVEDPADFGRQHAFVAGTVISRNGKEIGLALRKIGGDVACDDFCRERRSSQIVCAGRRADVYFVASQVGFPICLPCECHIPVDPLAGGGVDSGVEWGGGDGGMVITGVCGCNKLAMAEFLNKFTVDRELQEEALLPPAETAACTLAVPVNGEGAIGATTTELGEVIPARGAATGVVMSVSVVGIPCPAAMSDGEAAWGM